MKKVLALLLVVLMISSCLVGCGGKKSKDKITLTVWAADNAQAFTRKVCDQFIADHDDIDLTIEVKAQGEGDVASVVANDPEKAADVFSFACDQMNDLVDRMLLLPVYNAYKDQVRENSAFTVEAATAKDEDGEDELQAFPETGENGYYLVYDKSVVTDEDAQTLEGVLKACKAAGRSFVISCGNGFYSCIFPFTGGMECTGRDEDKIQTFNDYDKSKVIDSLLAFSELLHEYSDVIMDDDPTRIGSGFDENPRTVAAGIDGSWNAATVQEVLGSDFGAAKLPTININGTPTQIRSVKGCKLIGVNSHTEYPELSQELAAYLTSQEVQQQRLEDLSWAPANQELLDSLSAEDYPALYALTEQSAVEGNSSQVNIVTSFWGPMGTLGKKVKEGDATRSAIEDIFDEIMENFE